MNALLLLLPWALLGVCVWFGAVMIRQHGRMLLRLDALERELVISRIAQRPQSIDGGHADGGSGPPLNSLSKSKINRNGLRTGTRAPMFTLPRLDGTGTISASDYLGRAFLLVFASPDCTPCEMLMSRLADLPLPVKKDHLLVVTRRTEQPSEAVLRYQSGVPVLVQEAWEVSRSYATFMMPSAYVVNAEGMIVTDVMTGPDVISNAAQVLAGLTPGYSEQLSAAV